MSSPLKPAHTALMVIAAAQLAAISFTATPALAQKAPDGEQGQTDENGDPKKNNKNKRGPAAGPAEKNAPAGPQNQAPQGLPPQAKPQAKPQNPPGKSVNPAINEKLREKNKIAEPPSGPRVIKPAVEPRERPPQFNKQVVPQQKRLPPASIDNANKRTPGADDGDDTRRDVRDFRKRDRDNKKDTGAPGSEPPTPTTETKPAETPKAPVTATQPPANGSPTTTAPAATTAQPVVKPRTLDDLKRDRVQKVEEGGKRVVIQEPDKRVIVKQNDRIVIQRDENETIRRVAPNARIEKSDAGKTLAVVERPGNVKIVSETDANGQLLRRYRRAPDGTETIIIDNRYDNRRRHRDHFGRDLAVGAGIGLGVVAGAVILNSLVDVPPPRVRIPRDKYIVEYEDASDEDVYEALSAPPVDEYSDRYTLDEIRATERLRERMRRVDLDDITFEFGSWEVDPSQYGKLERIARAMRRVIERDSNEVFLIEGYTDAVGSREDNLTLSDRRAESVSVILSEHFDVPFENLTTQGYGEDYLKVPTAGPDRLNRRVAVRRITPLLARGDHDGRDQGDRGDDRGGRYDEQRDDGPYEGDRR